MSNFKLWMLLSILWIYSEALGQSNAFRFTHLTTKEGLSDSSVKGIVRDHQGFMWFGTANGLNRYDGYTFKIYKHQTGDTSTLTDNVINVIYEDRDSLLWIGTDIGLHLFDRSKDDFIRIPGPIVSGKPVSRIISAMLEDQNGNFWIGTDGGGLYLFDRQERIFTPFKKSGVYHGQNTVFCLFEDRAHHLWIGTLGGLFCLNTETQKFTQFPNRRLPSDVMRRDYVSDITETVNGDLLIATLGHGLYLFDRDMGIFTPFSEILTSESQQSGEGSIFALVNTKNGQIWIGTDSRGIQVWDLKQRNIHTCQNDPFDHQSVSSNHIQTIYEDPLGDLWIGTQSQGISYWSPRKKAFNHVRYFPNLKNGLSHSQVTSFFESKSGDIWLGTLGGGLNRFNPQTGLFSQYRHKPEDVHSLGNDLILSVIEDNEGQVWVVNSKWGVSCFDPLEEMPSFRQHRVRLPRSIFQDTRNRIWLGAGFGITQFDPVRKRFVACQNAPVSGEVTLTSVVSIYEDINQTVWFGAYEGLFYYDEPREQFIHFPFADSTLRGNIETPVSIITGDKEGNLWAGGNFGLVHILLSNGKISRWRIREGLPDDMVSNIAIDKAGGVWISTGHGLSVLDPITGNIRNYDRAHDLSDHEFNPRASMVTKSGQLYFGGTNGFHVFHPDSIYDNTIAPPVHITNLYMHDRLSLRSSQGYPLFSRDHQMPTSRTKNEHYLKPWQNSLTFAFAALNYLDPKKNLYKYRLEGFQEEWILTSSEHRIASYPKLPPGTYTFRVSGSNNDQYWNETGDWLRFHIAEPWYWSWWSKSLYLIAIIVFVYFLYRYQLRKKLVQAELFRLQELDTLKTRLFTNISHEFRTPLTVITGTAEGEIEKKGKLSKSKNLLNAQLIKRNSDQMLNLVNQMLSLRKLDSGNARLRYVNADIIPFLRYLLESFYSVAEVKKIQLEMRSTREVLCMDYDPNQLKTIVTNLLTNALKFTQKGDQVLLLVDTVESCHNAGEDVSFASWLTHNVPALSISVRDTGLGIKAEALPHIFDRFYQAENGVTNHGTGIGLDLTKELVKLLGGHITIKSKEGEGTEATIILPITQQAPVNKDVQSFTPTQTDFDQSYLAPSKMKPSLSDGVIRSAELPLILIIEDNSDVLQYLQSCLKDDYDLIFAEDGKKGIEQAFQVIPHLIISDVMMPLLDGYEVCKTLKEDIRTSHIPIILLTAKADMGSKLEGLREGADDYLTKPFDKKELLLRLKNLLQQRKRLQQYYLSLATGAKIASDSPNNDHEDRFIRRLRSFIERHLDDPSFSVEKLCREVGVSHAQLHRKATALTGFSAHQLIRSIRLSKAKELIRGSEMNISEIAYETGFNDPAYFTRVFRKEFGITPSRYKKGIAEEVGK